MKALILDVLPQAHCEVTRKKDVECYRVRLEGGEEATITPLELLKMLRFRKAQEAKQHDTTKPSEDEPPTQPT